MSTGYRPPVDRMLTAWLPLGLAIVFVAVAVATDPSWARPHHGVPMADWRHYALSWLRVTEGGPLYAPIQYSGTPYQLPSVLNTGWAYPPPAILLFAPFAAWPAGWIAWTVVNLGLLLTGLWAIIRGHRYSSLAFAGVLVGLGLWQPFRNAAALGNADVGVAGLMAWAWVGRPWIAGAIGGSVKIVPGAFFLYGLRDGWRSIVPGVLVGVGLCVAALPLTGLDAWWQYGVALANATYPCGGENMSIACITGSRAAGLGLAGLMVVGAWLVPWRVVAFSLAAMAFPVANHDLRGHTWMPLAVVVVVLAAQITPSARRPICTGEVGGDDRIRTGE